MSSSRRVIVYPGTFDPLTRGHEDIVRRALNLFDEVIVAVAFNPQKHGLFLPEERVVLLNAAVAATAQLLTFNLAADAALSAFFRARKSGALDCHRHARLKIRPRTLRRRLVNIARHHGDAPERACGLE